MYYTPEVGGAGSSVWQIFCKSDLWSKFDFELILLQKVSPGSFSFQFSYLNLNISLNLKSNLFMIGEFLQSQVYAAY